MHARFFSRLVCPEKPNKARLSASKTIIWPMYPSSPPLAAGRSHQKASCPRLRLVPRRAAPNPIHARAHGAAPVARARRRNGICLRIAGGSLGLTRDAPPNSRTAVVAKAAAATACHRQRRRGELAPPLASCRGQRRRERQPC